MLGLTGFERMHQQSVGELWQDVHHHWYSLPTLLEFISLLPAVQDHRLHEAFGESDKHSVEEVPLDLVLIGCPLCGHVAEEVLHLHSMQPNLLNAEFWPIGDLQQLHLSLEQHILVSSEDVLHVGQGAAALSRNEQLLQKSTGDYGREGALTSMESK